MTTLIATYNSEGCTGRCDAKCYEATTGNCDCICGGRNTCTVTAGGFVRCKCHGAGVERATENTRALAEEWLTAWKQAHSDTTYWTVPAAQLPLPLGVL